MLDFYALKSEVKVSLFQRWQQIDLGADPLVWAWIAHAFGAEGVENNPLLSQAPEQASRWLQGPNAWNGDAYLGGIGLLCPLLRQAHVTQWSQITLRLVERVKALHDMGFGKFSRLNDPDIVLGIVFGVGDQLPDGIRKWLRNHCERNAQPGNWRRGLLFAAAASELQGSVPRFAINGDDLQLHEIFPAVWFAERYPHLLDNAERRRGIWEAFEHVRDAINLEMTASGESAFYPASPIDVAMLYEALLSQTRDVDPVTLFNNIPWHPQVRRVSESLFVKGEYVMAVFQAGVLFIDAVKHRAVHPVDKSGRPLDGGPLMSHVFGSKTPALKFNALKDQTDRNEQQGLALMAEGVVSAIRNPKGHLPHTAIVLGPYEALEQLAVISYLMRRLDAAQT